MNHSYFIFLALLAGAALPLQAGLNAQMGKSLGHPMLAALVSFSVGAVSLLLITLLMKVPLQGFAGGYRSVSPWYWLSGTLGAFFVTTALVLSPRIGTAVTFSLTIAGQLLLSVLLDHFGLLGMHAHPVNGWRIAGVLLLITGVVLIRRF
jgi:bacterial/archaeal transporter family-2 protein